MYKCILFDMDGTLVDTYEGIFNAYAYALDKMGLEFGGRTFVDQAIGSPLLMVFKEYFSLSNENAQKAVEYYRDYYAEKGIKEAQLYKGMNETLQTLKKNGVLLGVATLKRETFAKEILKALNIATFFDVVYGIDEKDKLSKADLLEKCVATLNVSKKDTILVGDSHFDAQGAQKAGVDFMAVLYGYGFKEAHLDDYDSCRLISKSVSEISKKLLEL